MTRTQELRKRGAPDRVEAPLSDMSRAREILTATLDDDPFKRIEELREAGRRKAKAEGVAYRMERERKSLLARLSSEYSRTHADRKLSEAKLERLARADERYQKHIEGTAVAIEERELSNSEYWSIRARLEWLRAAVAHENALSRLDQP